MKMPIGVKRLDEVLEGGLPASSCSLLYGPAFVGKEVLARVFFLQGLSMGQPGIFILTGQAASDVRAELAGMDPRYHQWERDGLAHFVDAYSRSIGAEDDHPSTEYVDGPVNLNGVSLAVSNAQRRLIADHPHHRLVLDSVSTLVTYTNAQTTFRFLQILVGKAKRAGATSLLLLQAGMHADAEVQTFKHLVDGIVEMRTESAVNQLHVLGLGITESHGWVDYRFTPRSFDVTGSFAAGRIR